MKYKITLWVEKQESEEVLMEVLNDGLCAFSVETKTNIEKTNIEKISIEELNFIKRSEVQNDN